MSTYAMSPYPNNLYIDFFYDLPNSSKHVDKNLLYLSYIIIFVKKK